MTDTTEPPKNEMLIEVASLLTEEESELLEFLKTQPEVLAVSRRLKFRDSANLSRATIGFIVQHHDIVVRFAKELGASTAVSTLLN